MQVEHINPFVSAAFSVLQSVLEETPIKGQPSAFASAFDGHQISIVCGITGPLTGQVVYGMSMTTADRIVAKMGDQNLRVFNQTAALSVCELIRMITNQGLMKLAEAGLTCDASAPLLIRGPQVEFTPYSSPTLFVPLNTSIGAVNVTVGLRDKASLLKAA